MSQTNVNVPGNGESTGAGMIVGLILAVIVIGFLVWWFLLNGGNGGGTPADSSAPLQSLVESILPTGS
jgi:plastocyanin domain-containing protein